MPDLGLGKGEPQTMAGSDGNGLDKAWRQLLLLTWIVVACVFVYLRWDAIRWFMLTDTDDNMRIMQVRDLLAGQGWYDLRQYRLDPPNGADIHWSRLVDLPIAAIKLALTPFAGPLNAERAAAALAPMLPMGVAMAAIAVTARRLIAPTAFAVAIAIAVLLCAPSLRGMWSPMRIDHHGWQLAFLSLAMAALVDPKRARGGALLGVATGLSLTIGLEMLLYLAAAGATMVVMWIRDESRSRGLATYGASLAGACALGYLLFASYANRAPVCDALSPVWLSAMVAAGAVAVALAFLSPRSAWLRLGAAGIGGAAVAAGFAYFWPHCLGRLEGVSPEAQALWLNNVREAMPVYRHGAQTAIVIVSLPLTGLAGYALMLWRNRKDEVQLSRWASLAVLALLSSSLLLWQSRASAASQLFAIPGAAALGWVILPYITGSRHMLVRVFGIVGIFLLISGLLPQNAARLLPERKIPKGVNTANGRCPTLSALRPVALVPKGYVLTFVDLGPRLIAVTHHDAVAGPYHRNDEDIVDVMKTFRGTADFAHAMIARRGIDYVLICPGLSESTIYAAKAKNGFYMQLDRGEVPKWLERVPLPAKSPYKMWRVVKPVVGASPMPAAPAAPERK